MTFITVRARGVHYYREHPFPLLIDRAVMGLMDLPKIPTSEKHVSSSDSFAEGDNFLV
jgi:hypothetical protein